MPALQVSKLNLNTRTHAYADTHTLKKKISRQFYNYFLFIKRKRSIE